MIKKTEKIWHVDGTRYRYGYPGTRTQVLENAVYILCVDESGYFLNRTQESFELPAKIYGSDYKFAERTIKTWEKKKNNVGVLLNGIKGSGKTVTAKMICNMTNMPVIMITHEFNGADEYLAGIQEDFVVYIDEYEKIYKKSDSLLGLMDGVLTGINRRLFLLTTNETHISSYLMDRPNRIRYRRSYNQLALDVIEEMVDDLLEKKEWRNEVINFLSILEILTIDIVGNVIEEVNIHNELPEAFKDYFNITLSNKKYNVFYHPNPNDLSNVEILSSKHTGNFKFDDDDEGDNIYVDGKYLGKLVRVADEDAELYELSLHSSDESYAKKFSTFKNMPNLLNKKILISFTENKYSAHPNFQGSSYNY